MELQRRVGLADAVTIGAGSMIGAGVFTAWAPAADAAGRALLVGLVIAAAVAFCNATSSAQLAALHPESGGTYVYARYRLGPAWGHLAGWGFVVGKTASCAAMALAVGAYVWPAQQRLAAALAVVLITAVNLGGLERTAFVTRWLLACSLVALIVVVVAGWSSDETSLATLTPLDAGIPEVLRSAGFLFFAFAGYARIATLGEEVVDPEVTIPRAITRALTFVLIVYAIVGVTALASTPVDVLAGSDAPLKAVVDGSPLDALAPVVEIGAAIASLGVLLNLIPGVSRTTLAMARRAELPEWLAHVDGRRNQPLRAELTVAGVVLLLVLVVGLHSAIALSGVAVLTYYAITNAAAFTLPPEERRWPRWICVVGAVGCLALAVFLPFEVVLVGTAVLLLGVVIRRVTS
ncbi:MAG TPA: APC family permease [Ilumatobacter sp.]|nr:APC family permease [Ilumatobacter sp.]